MRLTVRLENNNYLDLEINFNNQEITFLSGIPNTELDDLMQLADEYNFTFNLPITDHVIEPEIKDKILTEASVVDVLTLLMTLSTIVVTEY